MIRFILDRVENMGKGESAINNHFLLFPHSVFITLLFRHFEKGLSGKGLKASLSNMGKNFMSGILS